MRGTLLSPEPAVSAVLLEPSRSVSSVSVPAAHSAGGGRDLRQCRAGLVGQAPREFAFDAGEGHVLHVESQQRVVPDQFRRIDCVVSR